MNNQLSKSFKIHNTHLFIDDFNILIYKLYARWLQNKQSHQQKTCMDTHDVTYATYHLFSTLLILLNKQDRELPLRKFVRLNFGLWI